MNDYRISIEEKNEEIMIGKVKAHLAVREMIARVAQRSITIKMNNCGKLDELARARESHFEIFVEEDDDDH